MLRAKVIKAEQKRREEINPNTFGLAMYIDSVYQRYIDMCYACNEQPLILSKWLTQDIEPFNYWENENSYSFRDQQKLSKINY